ncbi:hypothetical protein JKF63_05819 [Porcisia hertigi]|uniref:Uncharacterized protein n=1 Tax=Porcisia hertigi TaxID=2761500 RepID=A0A836IXQ9_9TRYP|nr:hypothetical protein JKF63_05819 [Porcisia hertigi]
MHQRMDACGGAFDTYEQLREANAEKLQTLLKRTAHRTSVAAHSARSAMKSASLTGDYLDFKDPEFGGKWVNLGLGLLVAGALFLFYVLWFTDWIK